MGKKNIFSYIVKLTVYNKTLKLKTYTYLDSYKFHPFITNSKRPASLQKWKEVCTHHCVEWELLCINKWLYSLSL